MPRIRIKAETRVTRTSRRKPSRQSEAVSDDSSVSNSEMNKESSYEEIDDDSSSEVKEEEVSSYEKTSQHKIQEEAKELCEYNSSCEQDKEEHSLNVVESKRKSKEELVFESKPKKTKFLIDEEIHVKKLKKEDFVLYNSEVHQVVKVESADEIEKIQLRLKSSKTKAKVRITYATLNNVSVYANLMVLIVNSNNQAFEINLPVNLNSTLEDLQSEFSDLYKVPNRYIVLILNGKRLEKKDLQSSKIGKTYNSQWSLVFFISFIPSVVYEFARKNLSGSPSVSMRNHYYDTLMKNLMIATDTIVVESIHLSYGTYDYIKIMELNIDLNTYLIKKGKKKDQKDSLYLSAEKYELDKAFEGIDKLEKGSGCKTILELNSLKLKMTEDNHSNSRVFVQKLSPHIQFLKHKVYYIKASFQYKDNQNLRTPQIINSNKVSLRLEFANCHENFETFLFNPDKPLFHFFTPRDSKFLCFVGMNLFVHSPIINT